MNEKFNKELMWAEKPQQAGIAIQVISPGELLYMVFFLYLLAFCTNFLLPQFLNLIILHPSNWLFIAYISVQSNLF